MIDDRVFTAMVVVVIVLMYAIGTLLIMYVNLRHKLRAAQQRESDLQMQLTLAREKDFDWPWKKEKV